MRLPKQAWAESDRTISVRTRDATASHLWRILFARLEWASSDILSRSHSSLGKVGLRRRVPGPVAGGIYLLRRSVRRLIEHLPLTRARSLGRRLVQDRLAHLLREREAHALHRPARRLRSHL